MYSSVYQMIKEIYLTEADKQLNEITLDWLRDLNEIN